MERAYDWEHHGGRGGGLVGLWLGLAVVLALAVHAGGVWLMRDLSIRVDAEEGDWASEQVVVSERMQLEDAEMLPPTEVEELAPEEAGEMLSEVEDLMPELDVELDAMEAQLQEPDLAAYDPGVEAEAASEGEMMDFAEEVAAPDVSEVLEQIGRRERLFPEVASGQIVVEQGGVEVDLEGLEAKLRESAQGLRSEVGEGSLPKGYASLDHLLGMSEGELNKNRSALPSDLIFDYNSADIRRGARRSLMKLGLLMERNPSMFCVLEGHSDLYGSAAYNLELSRRRAETVKRWLVKSVGIEGERIVVRAFGKSRPKVKGGSIEEQSINRRVDILMRKEVPKERAAVRAVVVDEGGDEDEAGEAEAEGAEVREEAARGSVNGPANGGRRSRRAIPVPE